jgi:integrase
VGKFKEPEGRTLYLTEADERAVCEALKPEHRALFTVSVNTGLRWSEQVALSWADTDFLTGLITVRQAALRAAGQGRRPARGLHLAL